MELCGLHRILILHPLDANHLLVPETNLSALLPTSKIHQKGTATSSQEELCETPKSHSYVLNKENVSLTLNS